MKKISLFFTLLFLTTTALAQTVAKDTISFSTDNVVLEDDPNHQNHIFSLYSLDGQWKAQLNYYAESLFGTFDNEDFRLSGEGKYYNFVRNPKNDMQFWAFSDMLVTVTDETSRIHIEANCLTSSGTRFLMEGFLSVPAPTDTICSDLGYTPIVKNDFYGTYAFHAQNEDYDLEYGLLGNDVVGTFYTADLLKPVLFDKNANTEIAVKSATAVHEQVGDTLKMTLDVLSEDLHLYRLSMFNTQLEIEVIGEEEIVLTDNVVLQDLTQMYGCYQLFGMNAQWAVAIGLVPDAIGEGRTEWTMEDIFMPYTTLMRLPEEERLELHDIHLTAAMEEEQVVFRADMLTRDGMLYHVTFRPGSIQDLPEAKETINIDFGPIAVLDYSHGMGVVGLGGIVPDQYQMRLYLYAPSLSGSYTTEDIIPDMCDVMVVHGNTFAFHDAWLVNTKFNTDEAGVNHVTVDMMTADSVLYHATMEIAPMKCMTNEAEYQIGIEDAVMISLMEAYEGESEYTVQLQCIDDVYDDDFRVVGDGYVFSFHFAHEGEGISGEYGYSAGTLSEDEVHTFFENGAEVTVAPVAGTLSLTPVEQLSFEFWDQEYHTNLYQIQFQFVGQNGVIYRGQGQNLLLCIDEEGDLFEVNEPELSSLNQVLAEQGYVVKKVLKGGKFIIGQKYGIDGTQLEK